MPKKPKKYDINKWVAVRIEGGGWEVKVQVGPKRWLTVCDVYCLTIGREVWPSETVAQFIAQMPKLKKLSVK